MENIIPSFQTRPSPKDKRTVQHSSLTQISQPLVSGGVEYLASDIENQAKVGICTAISLVQNQQKANGKKYSADFQYLLQKKFYDLNWIEGSCVLNALKVAKNYGFLPAELWTWTTQADRNLTYAQYITKLQTIPDTEVHRLLALCVDKIPGYAQITNPADAHAMASAIQDSKSGILCRVECGTTWWTSIYGRYSWAEKDLDPLRYPNPSTGGHAIGLSNFDFNMNNQLTTPNTWSPLWCRNGSADLILDNYPITEAWVITQNPIIQKFNTDLKFGMSGDLVVNLQNGLKIKGFFNYSSTGFFGPLTWLSVKAYQRSKGIISTGNCFILTRTALNLDFNL